MKRQSKAEEALAKQIKGIRLQIEGCNDEIHEQEIKREAFREVLIKVEDELDRLQQQRISASKRNKPGAD